MTTTPAAPPTSDMPDITDTGTIIGNMKLQAPLEPASPIILVTEDGNNNNDASSMMMMQIDSSNPINTNNEADADVELEEEEDALHTIEKFRSDELSSRVEAARKLPSIALALGPERTRD